MATMTDQITSRYIDNVRLSDSEYRQIVRELDADSKIRDQGERRSPERVPYRQTAGLRIELQPTDETIPTYLVQTRNISSRGIGFLFGRLARPRTMCVVQLTNRHGHITAIPGEVVHCRRVHEHVHEVGVRFNHAIDVTEFLAPDEF